MHKAQIVREAERQSEITDNLCLAGLNFYQTLVSRSVASGVDSVELSGEIYDVFSIFMVNL